jgi:hypothetical protein
MIHHKNSILFHLFIFIDFPSLEHLSWPRYKNIFTVVIYDRKIFVAVTERLGPATCNCVEFDRGMVKFL